ncbi:MAG: ABC transporter ATP-binding protein [Clostridia bacterium]|nr:ABC transporter ATP-binding protein [Clostridia bacterium]
MEYALQIKNLHKCIKKNKILNDISLKINSGEAMGLIGPNGAGKTSLIKCIAGLWKADSGSIEICGNNIKTDTEKALSEAGFIIEYPKLFGDMPPAENIQYLSSFYNIKLSRKDIEDTLESIGLKDFINKKIKTFSSGMYQKVCLAALIVRKPKFLILDEPTASLDPKSIIDFRNILIKIRDSYKISMLISSHNLAEVEKICDSVAILDKGVILDIKNLNNKDIKKYIIIFKNAQEANLAAKTLRGNSYKADNNIINLNITIAEFKEFISKCPFEIQDIKTGDLESEFLSVLQGGQNE